MKDNQKRKSRKTRPRAKKAATTLTDPLSEWYDLPAKRKAFLAIMRDIINDPDLGNSYLESDTKAADAFRAKGLQVPLDVKVVFLPAGDSDKMPLGAGSAIIELPPRTATSLSDPELLELFDCTYHIAW